MNNKKGFTLIELLAIIVILAVIMAIAIPQVLNVVNGSKSSAWKDNIKMISKAIELNTQMFDVETGGYTYTVDSLCKNPTKVNEISKSSDVTISCQNGIFTLSGTGQFDGFHAEINCSSGNCNGNTYAKGAYCDESVGHIWNFDYTGSEQKFIAPCQGTYRIETWGAEGNVSSWGGIAGYGGYSEGEVNLKSSNNLYLYVGNKKGYNGGGSSSTNGGGATSVTTNNRGELVNFKNNIDEILIVSGGGGAAEREKGGSGGGFIGGSGLPDKNVYLAFGTGGSQTIGGIGAIYNGDTSTLLGNLNGSFGQGGSGLTTGDSGPSGGGGFYGGGATTFAGGAGGGSGYIGNPLLTNKAMYCYNCQESNDPATYTISTTGTSKLKDTTNCPDGYSSSAVSKCAKAGNGYARITYIGKN